jgi:hypothetical protein
MEMMDEQEEKRCCDASPHDTKVMRAIRKYMNEHFSTDCDVDKVDQIIGLIESLTAERDALAMQVVGKYGIVHLRQWNSRLRNIVHEQKSRFALAHDELGAEIELHNETKDRLALTERVVEAQNRMKHILESPKGFIVKDYNEACKEFDNVLTTYEEVQADTQPCGTCSGSEEMPDHYEFDDLEGRPLCPDCKEDTDEV